METNLPDKDFVIFPPCPRSRFTLDEWQSYNKLQIKTNLNQQQLTQKLVVESERVRDEIKEFAELNRREVEFKTERKLEDIKFEKSEIVKERKDVNVVIELLVVYETRIKSLIHFIENTAIPIAKKCTALREGRLGIDLCHDEVERALHDEQVMMEKSVIPLTQISEELREQLRKLRSNLYFLERDLEDKDDALQLDYKNLSLKKYYLDLSMYHGFTPLDPSNVTVEEWTQFTRNNLKKTKQEINNAQHLRSNIDILLSQTVQDLKHERDFVNECLRARIDVTKEIKSKLEEQHSEIIRQVGDQSKNIIEIKKFLADQEEYMALAQTRMGNRAQRKGVELVRDLVETHLVSEVLELKRNCIRLKQMLTEVQASQRHLMRNKIQLETDINIKTNTLKIDEVDCMTLRHGLDYHFY